ncbi:MAG: hypothetical protein KDK39_16250 [Leptospiraceae bacterium]|nr:hypothetical protein [Leptospiraceae bacterium]
MKSFFLTRSTVINLALLCSTACFAGLPGSDNILDPANLTGALLNLDASQLKPVNFALTGSLHTGRCKHEMTELSNGKILITGGMGASGALNTAEIYDPDTGIFSQLAERLNHARYDHKAILLADNTVLLTGGSDNTSGSEVQLSSAEIFTGTTFTATGSMASARTMFTLNKLNDNRIIAIGGRNSSSSGGIRKWSIYSAGTWTNSTAELSIGRYSHSATSLSDGRILVGGGAEYEAVTYTAEIINSGATAVSTIANLMREDRKYHSAVLLQNGNVLFVGWGSRSEIWNTGNQLFVDAGAYSPVNNQTVLLNDGTPLVIGGSATLSSPVVREAYTYNINTDNFSFAGRMNQSRQYFSAIKLSSGKVLVSGGCVYDSVNTLYLQTAEIYEATSN